MNGIGFFFLLIGFVLLGIGLAAVILKKSGKFCPDCEKVFYKGAIMCPRCKTDLRYAKSVKEYLSEKPKIMPKGTAVSGSGQLTVRPLNVSKRFCVYCGKELPIKVLFCPHCGNKVN